MKIVALLRLATAGLLLFTVYEQYQTINTLKGTVVELRKQDSTLQDSLFLTSIELGRYQITLENLKEEDLKAANKFEHILTTQTE